jgi:hypothetical protein
MNTKIIDSLTYGPVVWRKIATMSIFTFAAEDPDQFAHWNKAHPKTFFRTMSVERTDKEGVFHVWLPLLDDNREWKMPSDRYRRTKEPTFLPTAYDHNAVNHWINFAKPFLLEIFIELPEGWKL